MIFGHDIGFGFFVTMGPSDAIDKIMLMSYSAPMSPVAQWIIASLLI